jgi:hypothetical protein
MLRARSEHTSSRAALVLGGGVRSNGARRGGNRREPAVQKKRLPKDAIDATPAPAHLKRPGRPLKATLPPFPRYALVSSLSRATRSCSSLPLLMRIFRIGSWPRCHQEHQQRQDRS